MYRLLKYLKSDWSIKNFYFCNLINHKYFFLLVNENQMDYYEILIEKLYL